MRSGVSRGLNIDSFPCDLRYSMNIQFVSIGERWLITIMVLHNTLGLKLTASPTLFSVADLQISQILANPASVEFRSDVRIISFPSRAYARRSDTATYKRVYLCAVG